MKKINEKIRVLMLAILLTAVSVVSILTFGQTYTFKMSIGGQADNIDDILITVEDGSNTVKILDKSLEDGILKLRLEAVNPGDTIIGIEIPGTDVKMAQAVYAHKTGVVTRENFFGDCSGDIVIPISISLLSAYILYLLIKAYRKNCRESICQYKNIVHLGLIIFLVFVLLCNLGMSFNYNGIYDTVNGIINLFSVFSSLLLPVALTVSALVIISNLVLIKREGFTMTNLLGLFLGGLLCCLTVFPTILYRIFYMTPEIDIHNTGGIYMYISLFVETATYIFVAYLECILLSTIILAFRAARYIPQFDKDYILILGCQIRKDGTLTKLLQSRVDRAIEFARMQKEKTGKDIIFVPSGGQGSDEIIAEADAMKNYLLEVGVEREQILVENKSTNSYENIKFSLDIINKEKKDAKIAFSTTNYHVFRVGAIAYDQGIEIEGIGAKTKAYFWINAFIREFIATLVSEKKKHLLFLCLIIIPVTALMILLYFANNM